MEHPCPKCGAAVENGAPFCPQCNAPQIRVFTQENNEPVTPPLPPGTPDEVQPPATPVHTAMPPYRPVPDTRRMALRAAIMGGMIGGFGALIPSVPFIVLMMVAAGGLTITFYQRRAHEPSITSSQGFRLGMLGGFFGSLLYSLFISLTLLSTNTRNAVRQSMAERLKEAMDTAVDAPTRQMITQLGETIATPSGLATVFFIFLGIFSVMFIVLAGIGGMIGAAMFGRQRA